MRLHKLQKQMFVNTINKITTQYMTTQYEFKIITIYPALNCEKVLDVNFYYSSISS